MIAAAIVRHRQGGFIRVRIWTGDHARRDRNAWVRANNGSRAIPVDFVARALSLGSGARTAYLIVDGVDLGVRDIGANWRTSLEAVATNHRRAA